MDSGKKLTMKTLDCSEPPLSLLSPCWTALALLLAHLLYNSILINFDKLSSLINGGSSTRRLGVTVFSMLLVLRFLYLLWVLLLVLLLFWPALFAWASMSVLFAFLLFLVMFWWASTPLFVRLFFIYYFLHWLQFRAKCPGFPQTKHA